MATMLHFVLNLCRRPAVRLGSRCDPQGRFRDPRFASFLAQNNRRSTGTELFGAMLQRGRILRFTVRLTLVGGAAWVILESARALSVF